MLKTVVVSLTDQVDLQLFRGLFICVLFITTGMSLDVILFVTEPPQTELLTLLLIFSKTAVQLSPSAVRPVTEAIVASWSAAWKERRVCIPVVRTSEQTRIFAKVV